MANDFVVDTTCARELLGWKEITTRDERLDGLIDWLRRSRAP